MTAPARPALPRPAKSAWLLLTVAIAGESAGAIALRYADGFTRWVPTLVALACFTLALTLVSRVMQVLPVSVAYPMWAGGATATVGAVGIAALGEPVDRWTVFGIALVIAGVVVLNSDQRQPRSGC